MKPKNSSLLEVLVEPIEGELLSFTAFLVVSAVMFDALDCHELLNTGRPVVGFDGVLFVKKFFIFRNDGQLRPFQANQSNGRCPWPAWGRSIHSRRG